MPAKPLQLLLALPLLLLAWGCGKAPEQGAKGDSDAIPRVSHARILLPPPGGSMATGYFEVNNPGTTAIELRAVSSSSFASVEMHETREQGGMSRMRPVEKVEIPAGGSASFGPGGKHLMLMDSQLDADKPAREVPMSLEFVAANGSKRVVEVRFAVQAVTGESGASDH